MGRTTNYKNGKHSIPKEEKKKSNKINNTKNFAKEVSNINDYKEKTAKEKEVSNINDYKEKNAKEKKISRINSTKTYKEKNREFKKIKIFFIFIFVLIIICCYAGLFLLYGPNSDFRDWLITTAMATMNHQYLATWFYDNETIESCLNANTVEDTLSSTDTDLIEIVDYSEEEEITYENEYERQVLEKDSDNNDYKIIEIEGDKYTGYLAVIYDPSRVRVAASKYLGESGQYLSTISEETDALVAINAGGFADDNYEGTGGIPTGIVISEGEYLWNSTYSGKGGLIGLNQDNKLVLGKYSVSQAKTLGIRDAVSFGPFLIVNGEAVAISGNGGQGTGPRTVIGQRKDGIILFLVLDGDRTLGQGATIKELQEIMINYGAYNAANLDGGTSSSMTVNGVTINDPTTISGTHRTRPIATAFILEKDDSDDGDYSVVADKIDN